MSYSDTLSFRPAHSSWYSDRKWERVLDEPACPDCLRRRDRWPDLLRATAIENAWCCASCLELFRGWLNDWDLDDRLRFAS